MYNNTRKYQKPKTIYVIDSNKTITSVGVQSFATVDFSAYDKELPSRLLTTNNKNEVTKKEYTYQSKYIARIIFFLLYLFKFE